MRQVRRNKGIWVWKRAAASLSKHLKDFYMDEEVDRSCKGPGGKWRIDTLLGERAI